MRRLGSILKILLITLVLGAGGAAWLWHTHSLALSTPMRLDAGREILVVRPGSTIQTVAHELVSRGLIEQPYSLIAHARWTGKGSAIKAGEFEIPAAASPAALLDHLVSGRVVQHSLTLIEGWTFREVRAAVAADDRLTATLSGLDDTEVMARLGASGDHPEGRFLVDTYHFPRGTTDVEFLARAMVAMRSYLDAAWDSREEGLPLRSPYEALILASIVEKETGDPAERPQIAGVFVERLRRKMRLETDPTVIYGMGERFDGNIRRRDLRADTPYNTYVHKGLPPTPIAMPSRQAIDAALHPVVDGSLFFVSRGDGTHYFSRTYAEHRKAVIKYQINRNRSRKAPKSGG